MSEQKQHVNFYRKILLRKNLLKHITIPTKINIYVPFIGEGDIAVELYKKYCIFGADNDKNRVNTALKRLSNTIHTVQERDCNLWAFNGIKTIFQIADFDAYSYPYTSFRAFWKGAKKANELILFFTDTQKMPLTRCGRFILPNGEHQFIESKNERRYLGNFYFKRIIKPWFQDYIKPYKITTIKFYLRGHTLYWGAIMGK